MITLIAFILLLSIVIFVHELGHFVAGRKLGIGVERFALGFGRAIYKKEHNGVEYRFNWIPFGGYVKFVGDEPDKPVPPELRHIAFNTAPVYKRAITAFAGPAMNVVLAFFLFCVVYVGGQPMPTTLIGDVEPDSPAALAGLLPGDRVTALNGKAIEYWDELAEWVSEHPEERMTMTVARGNETLDLSITPERITALNLFGFDAERGSIGVFQYGPKAWIGIKNTSSAAYAAGLRTGDLILSINDDPVVYQSDLERVLRKHDGSALSIAVAREEENLVAEEPKISYVANIPIPAEGQPAWSSSALGMETGDLYIYQVSPDTPAAKAGFEAGDRLLSINGEPLTKWKQFSEVIRNNAEETVAITFLRNGEEKKLRAVPAMDSSRDLLGKLSSFGRIGLSPHILYTRIDTKIERYFNPIKIFKRGLEESWRWTVVTMKGFFYLLIGKAPTSSLGGPIMIAQLAGKTASLGWIPFVFFMAVISLNLAFINLFPIPVLDGGHLLMLTIEGIRGKPMSDRAIGIAQRIGLTLIGALILLVFYNDLTRVWYDLKDRFLQ